MLYVKASVINGNPDLDWSNPPIESYQISDTERYCKMPDNVDILPSWIIITEQEFNQNRPTISEPQPVPNLEDKVNYIYYKSMGVIV